MFRSTFQTFHHPHFRYSLSRAYVRWVRSVSQESQREVMRLSGVSQCYAPQAEFASASILYLSACYMHLFIPNHSE